jgi:hypothetical protein
MDLKLKNLKQIPPEEFPLPASGQAEEKLTGILHYKYIPKTGDWGNADAAYAVLTPSETPNQVVKEMWHGEGTVKFHKAKWEDMPTQFTIVNTLAELEIKEYCGAKIVKTAGGKDLSDQRILL